jgi:hypothetical protein
MSTRDEADVSEHVAYPTGGWENQGPCPASHPKRLVKSEFLIGIANDSLC